MLREWQEKDPDQEAFMPSFRTGRQSPHLWMSDDASFVAFPEKSVAAHDLHWQNRTNPSPRGRMGTHGHRPSTAASGTVSVHVLTAATEACANMLRPKGRDRKDP